MGEIREVTDQIIDTMYTAIYTKCLDSYENILNAYPELSENIKTNNWALSIKKNNPDVTEREMIAHAYTMMLMVRVICA
jgi:hypothetical protein